MASTKSPVFFNPNTTYYRSHFALKTIIQLVSEQDEPPSRSFQLDFAPVWSDICQMLRWYGANQVGKLRTAPDTLMEVQFASDKALKKFLQSQQKIETAMAEVMTARLRTNKLQDPSTTFKASTMLLLVTPNDTTGSTEFRPVTLANHRNCVSLYIKSKMAELPSDPDTALKTAPEDVLTEDDLPELMKLLSDVVDWHGLGLFLGIPPHKLQMIESDLSGAQVGRTLRLLSCVLVEWMQNHQEATWSTLVHALSSIGKRPAARRIAHEYGIHIPDESVLKDLTPEESEKLQEILEEIKKVLNSQPSDMEMVKIQNAIKEAQQKKQLTLKTFASIVEDTISKVKVLLAEKKMLEDRISDKERQLQELREGQGATASSLKQEVTELKQQLLETNEQLSAVTVQHSSELFKKSSEIHALTSQTQQLMSENDKLGAVLCSNITLIKSLETSSSSLIQLTTNLQLSLDMALQHQQQLTSQIQQQEEQHEHEVAALREKVHVQQKRDEQHSSSPELLDSLKQISDYALKQLDLLSEEKPQPEERLAEPHPVLEQHTCQMQIPKGHNPRKQGWKDVVMVISFTMRRLRIFGKEEEIEAGPPITTFEFSQVYKVQTLRPGEHEIVRVKLSDSKKILVLFYIEQQSSETQRFPLTRDHEETTVNIRGHQFVEIVYHTPSNCDVCNKTLPWSINVFRKGQVSYECKRCHLKCHKEHVDKGESTIQPCVDGELKKLLLLIKNTEDRSRWLNQLSRITRGDSQRPPSPLSVAVQRPPETQQAPHNYATYTGSGSRHRLPLPVELLQNSD